MSLLEATNQLRASLAKRALKSEVKSLSSDLVPSSSASVTPLIDDICVENLAVSLLDSSSSAIRNAVGHNLSLVLLNQQDDTAAVSAFTRAEMDSLLLLARSQNPLVCNMACDFIAQHLEQVPRGKLGLQQVLQTVVKLLELGTSTRNFAVMNFALHVGTAVAKEGDIWSKRLGEAWSSEIATLLFDHDISYQFRIEVLKCCSALQPNTGELMRACLKSISLFPQDANLVLTASDSLLKPPPQQDFEFTEDDMHLLLDCAREFCLVGKEYRAAATLLRVLHSTSSNQSSILCDLFEECEVMATINTLYRHQSEFTGGKLESALFLQALLSHELDVARKVHLCECGLIIRLIRLASPSSGGTAEEETSEQHAFLPAVCALGELAKVERIGARIVLAGGLGPLFSHANSNRNTRIEAKRALAALGASNLGAVVDSWIKTFRSTAAGEEQLLPLADLYLYNGKRLMMTDPPLGFFEETVNNPNAILGKGAFSTVYKSKFDTADGEMCAVKRLTKAAAQDPNFAEEIRVLARIPAHPNIIGLLGVYINDQECLICSELGGPTLNSVAAKLTWRERVRVLFGIAEAMRHLHGLDPCVLHMDLKASNVLVVDGQAKLCDFGLAVELRRGFEFLLPGEHGTIQYMAPEVMREDNVELSRGFTVGAEVYSFAMVMWEVAHPGRIPWQDESFPDIGMDLDITGAIRKAVISGRRPRCENQETWPPGYQQLMEMCWQKHSSDRPTFVGNFFYGDGEKPSSTNNVICSVVLRKMIWSCSGDQPRSRWPALKRVLGSRTTMKE